MRVVLFYSKRKRHSEKLGIVKCWSFEREKLHAQHKHVKHSDDFFMDILYFWDV